MLEALGERPGMSLPTAFQDWSNTKAAYRFFSNGNVSEDKIMEGHFAVSALRIQATDGPVLILQDTTEFSFKRAAPEKIWLHEDIDRPQAGGWSLPETCDLWPADACQPGDHARWPAAGLDGGQIRLCRNFSRHSQRCIR
jgi:hypothetical protein